MSKADTCPDKNIGPKGVCFRQFSLYVHNINWLFLFINSKKVLEGPETASGLFRQSKHQQLKFN